MEDFDINTVTPEELQALLDKVGKDEIDFAMLVSAITEKKGNYHTLALLFRSAAVIVHGVAEDPPTMASYQEYVDQSQDAVTEEWVAGLLKGGPRTLIPILVGLQYTFQVLAARKGSET